MGIILLSANPGEGKSYTAADLAARLLRRGHRVFSSFAIHGCGRLLSVADCLCDEFADSVFIVDEAGLAFSNRQTMDYDPMVNLAFTQHRKGGCDLYIIVQDLGLLELNIKRITEEVWVIKRWGPSGERSRGASRPASFFHHPWRFAISYYSKRDFDDAWALKLGAVPFRTRHIWYHRRVALSYSSFERVIPIELRDRVTELQRSAAVRARLPLYSVVNGRMQHTDLGPEYAELMLPRRMSPRDKVVPPPATLADTDFVGTVESMGLRVPPDVVALRASLSRLAASVMERMP